MARLTIVNSEKYSCTKMFEVKYTHSGVLYNATQDFVGCNGEVISVTVNPMNPKAYVCAERIVDTGYARNVDVTKIGECIGVTKNPIYPCRKLRIFKMASAPNEVVIRYKDHEGVEDTRTLRPINAMTPIEICVTEFLEIELGSVRIEELGKCDCASTVPVLVTPPSTNPPADDNTGGGGGGVGYDDIPNVSVYYDPSNPDSSWRIYGH